MTEIQELEPKLGGYYHLLNRYMLVSHDDIQDAGTTPEVILKHVLQHAPEALELAPQSLAEELIWNHPDLERYTAAAFESGDYTKLACLNVLQRSASVGAVNVRHQGDFLDENLRAMRLAWATPYIGNSHELLFHALENQLQPSAHLMNTESTTSIIQSSGTGKSRMANETRKLVFAIPFNIRRPTMDRNLGTYPPSDSKIYDYLVVKGNDKNYFDHFLRFFEALFRNVLNLFSEQFRFENGRRGYNWKPDSRELAEWWSKMLDKNREELYGKIVAYAQIRAKKPATTNDVTERAIDSLRRLLQVVKEKTADRRKGEEPINIPLELLIYFDEAQSLLSENDSDEERSRYHQLCRAISSVKIGKISTVSYLFLSTDPSVAKYSPPVRVSSSPGLAPTRISFPPPMVWTPFDCHSSLLDQETRIKAGPDLTLESVQSFDFMVRFGRPLFWSVYKGYREIGVGRPGENVKYLAFDKLIKSLNSSRWRMVAIDVIHHLDYEPRRTSAGVYESNLVENYMRMLYSISEDRAYMRSGYPSEPILAETACDYLWSLEEKEPRIVIDTLNDGKNNELLSKEESDELMARILLSGAYRRAVHKGRVIRHPKSLYYHQGCPLLTFLRELLSETFIDKVLQSYADGRESGLDLKTAMKTGIVRFTHFIKAGDDSSVTAEAAWAAFIRGAAIICKNCQAAIDLIIPVFLCDDPEKTPLCEHAMTAIFVRVRDRSRALPLIHAEVDALEVRFFRPGGKCDHQEDAQVKEPVPFMMLIMDLRAHWLAGSSVSSDDDVHYEQRANTSNWQERSRYTICVRGCSHTVYKGIRWENESEFAKFLRSRDSFAGWNHAVQNLKPVWTRGSPCYDWLVNDRLNGPVVQDQGAEREGVDVGDACYVEDDA